MQSQGGENSIVETGRHEVILWALFLPDYSGNENFLGRNVLKT